MDDEELIIRREMEQRLREENERLRSELDDIESTLDSKIWNNESDVFDLETRLSRMEEVEEEREQKEWEAEQREWEAKMNALDAELEEEVESEEEIQAKVAEFREFHQQVAARLANLTDDTRRVWIKRNLDKIVSNDGAKEIISWILFDALSNNQACKMNIAWLGPSGAGKTMFSRVFAKTLCVPFLEIGPDKDVKTTEDIGNEIIAVLEKHRFIYRDEVGEIHSFLPSSEKGFVLPPMVILLDEAHDLDKNIVQALLKATETKDGVLVTESNQFDCTNVCWQIATTDLGDMFDAFVTRFEQIRLRLYTKDEIAQIINKDNPDLDVDTCDLIASYCNRIPREALRFAQLVKKAQKSIAGTWETVVERVAQAKGIDKFGMTTQRLNILRALGQRPMSVNQLCATAACKPKELQKFVLPWLLEATPDQEPFVVTVNKHYITPEGLKELEKRGIPHRGEAVLCCADKD